MGNFVYTLTQSNEGHLDAVSQRHTLLTRRLGIVILLVVVAAAHLCLHFFFCTFPPSSLKSLWLKTEHFF